MLEHLKVMSAGIGQVAGGKNMAFVLSTFRQSPLPSNHVFRVVTASDRDVASLDGDFPLQYKNVISKKLALQS